MRLNRRFALGALSALFVTVLGQHGFAQEELFKGKTITVVIPYTAGGPTDLSARAIISKLSSVIPGNPVIKPVNMPGAGGVLGSNYVYSSGVTDGTLVLFNTVMPWYQIIGDPTVRYDVKKSPMLAALGEPEVLYTAKGTGITSIEDLGTLKRTIRAAALVPNNTKSVVFHLMATLLNYDMKVINGYPGGAETRLAVQRGEADIAMETLPAFFGAVARNPNFIPLMQGGTTTASGKHIPDPRLEQLKLPTLVEVIEKKAGPKVWETTAGKAVRTSLEIYDVIRTVSCPPNTDPRAVAQLRDAVAKVLNDPEFRAQAEKMSGYPITFMLGKEAEDIIGRTMMRLEQDEEVIRLIREITKR